MFVSIWQNKTIDNSFLTGRSLSLGFDYRILDGSLPHMVFPRVLSLVRYCILSLHLGSQPSCKNLKPKASFTRMTYKHASTADPQMLLWSLGKWVMYWENWRHGCHPIACA